MNLWKKIIYNVSCYEKISKKYNNGEITVWQPNLCIHSTICFNGLPEFLIRVYFPGLKLVDLITCEDGKDFLAAPEKNILNKLETGTFENLEYILEGADRMH